MTVPTWEQTTEAAPSWEETTEVVAAAPSWDDTSEVINDKGVAETLDLAPNLIGDRPILDHDLKQYASAYGVPFNDLKDYVGWKGGVTQRGKDESLLERIPEMGKQAVGKYGNMLAFGAPGFAAKKLISDDPKFRAAVDDLNRLISRRQSTIQDVAEITGGIGAAASLGKGAAKLAGSADKAGRAVTAYDVASATGGSAAAGAFNAREGEEAETALQYGTIGFGLGGAAAGIGKGIGRLVDKRTLAKAAASPKEQGKLAKEIDKFIGTLSTRIGSISPEIKGNLRKLEHDINIQVAKSNKEVEPFLRELKKVKPEVKATLSKYVFNGEFEAADELMKSISPSMSKEFKSKVRPLLNNFGDQLQDAGHTFEKVDNFFPREVKDYTALRSALGMEEQGMISQQLAAYAKKQKTSVAKLHPDEKAKVINMALLGYRQAVGGAKPRFVRQRKISKLDDNLLKHYASPEESLISYIKGAVSDIEKRKFFGRAKKDAAIFDDAGKFDTEESIGRMVSDAIDSGDVPLSKEQELYDLIQARFIGEGQGPSSGGQILRELGFIGTIANPISAITQLGDLGTSAGLKGFKNTIGSMLGTKELKIVDLGLDDIGTELANSGTRKTAKLLNGLMSTSGFKTVDKLGKETFINASLKNARSMVKTPKGEDQLRNSVQGIFGKETESFIADMKAGNVTDNVKLWAFNQLSDIQPISLLEMPEQYLRAKNGRLLYMLKSFTLKQLDIVRRDVVQEWKQGNKGKAVKRAGLLAGYLTAANVGTQTVKDIMLGRDVRAEDLPDKALWTLLGAYGMNSYTYDKYLKQGKIVQGAVGYVTPATPILDTVFTLGAEIIEGDPKYEKALRGIPYVGPLAYNWFGGGAEKYNQRLRDKDRE